MAQDILRRGTTRCAPVAPSPCSQSQTRHPEHPQCRRPTNHVILSEAKDPSSIPASCLPILRALRLPSVPSALIFCLSPPATQPKRLSSSHKSRITSHPPPRLSTKSHKGNSLPPPPLHLFSSHFSNSGCNLGRPRASHGGSRFSAILGLRALTGSGFLRNFAYPPGLDPILASRRWSLSEERILQLEGSITHD